MSSPSRSAYRRADLAKRGMPLGVRSFAIGSSGLPPLEQLAEPSADVFCAALLGGSPNLGQAIGIRFDRFALHRAAPYEGVEKTLGNKDFD